jgi:uncharacterized protein (DUF433 family)
VINWKIHIETNPGKLFGKPVIVKTRIPVDLILEKLAAGDTTQDLLTAYPRLTPDDITACLLFAADAIKNEVLIPKAS